MFHIQLVANLPEIFFASHQNNLIQSVENNLTIILVQEWRFTVKSVQSCEFFFFFFVFPQSAVS